MLRAHHDERLVYVKRQRNHMCRTFRHPLGWPTASREWHYLNLLSDLGIRAPVPIFHGARRTPGGYEAVLVTEELSGFVPLSEFASCESSKKALLAAALGRYLGTLHRARLQHSSLYDKHVMVRWQGMEPEIALIDLEKMRPCLTRGVARRHDLEQLRRRQGVFGDFEWDLLLEAHRRSMNA